jgi:outer membrane lipopolysaccharide assembly protein LptE/RlpB
MEIRRIEELRFELAELLRKQNEVLESRMLGSASESELLEYEIRQEVVHQICDQLARSAAA